MRIAVGPAPSSWDTNRLKDLYRDLAQSPVDYVYVGETACPKRLSLSPDFLGRIADELARAGKEVYASSLTLVREEAEYRAFSELARRIGRIEVNSPAFLSLARHYYAVSGMFLNVYNSAAAQVLAQRMVKRIVLPCEIDLGSVASVTKGSPVPTEVLVHGHIPIAISAACNTARSLGRDGDDCQRLCRQYPEGMTLKAGDQPMFRIEGPQTLSAGTYCLVEHLPQLERAGVSTVRILPQGNHTGRIVRIYRDVLDRRRQCPDALEKLKALSSTGLCNGWFLGKAGWIYESQN